MITIVAYILFLVTGAAVSALAFNIGENQRRMTSQQLHNHIGAILALFLLWCLATHHIVFHTGLYALFIE